MADILTFSVKPAAEITRDMCRTMRNGLIGRGVSNPNVGPNSDWHLLFTAIGNELEAVGANAVVKCDQMMPDTAVGEDLERNAAVFDITPQRAAGSVGPVIIVSSALSPIPTDAELTDEAGLRYKVTVGGNYANGDAVTIEAIDVGDATNHEEGDVLVWANAPPYCDDKVTVGPGGLINGIDDEDSEILRGRELATLQTPPGAGNWEHFVETAEAASPSVQKGFDHPAGLGPATTRVVVVAAPTRTNKNRSVAPTIMSLVVVPFVAGAMPQHPHIGTTTVVNVPTDVAFAISPPDAPTANPAGSGGGWVNGTPWPRPDGVTAFRTTVTNVTSTVAFRVDAQNEPTPNESRIAWLSPFDWQLRTALVTSVTGSAGAYDITIDKPFPGIAVGCYIWPECENAQLYVDSVLNQYKVMGPGELSTNPSVLQRGYRHPPPALGWPMSLGPHLCNRITDDNDEVEAAQFMHRTDGTTTVTGSLGQIVPQVPADANSAPNIFVPRHIAFYRTP